MGCDLCEGLPFAARLQVHMRDGFTCQGCGRGIPPLSPNLRIGPAATDAPLAAGNAVTLCSACYVRQRPAAVVATKSNVLAEIAARHDVSEEAVRGPDRSARLVAARTDVAHRLRGLGWSLKEIGEILGGRDHTTVMNYFVRKRR